MYALGIDLGTTFTAAAVWRDGRAEISSLGSRGTAIPSVVVLREDETIITGESASRRALTSPHRVAREFKRRLGDTTPILLGGLPYSAEALMTRMLRSVVEEVTAREGGPPQRVCVSHPANWGPYKTDLLKQTVLGADLQDTAFTVEPVAAAVFYAGQQRMPEGAVVAVYDLGGGTFDAAVLRKSADGFEILGRPEGIERLGGIDFDAAVFGHVSRALGGVLQELDEDDPATIAAVARLKDECTQAKEALSADTDTTIPVILPNLSTEVRLTRAELELMVRPALQDTVGALHRALRSAGVGADQLHSVLLVGGSSRMPIVAQLIGSELGRPVAVDAHPKNAVALGAAILAGGAVSTPAPVPVPVPIPDPAPVAVPVIAMPVAQKPVAQKPVPVVASVVAWPVERAMHDTQVIPAVSPVGRATQRPGTAGLEGDPAVPVPFSNGPQSLERRVSSGRRLPSGRLTGATRSRLVATAAGVAVAMVALAGSALAALHDLDIKGASPGGRSQKASTHKPSSSALPADERCTKAIKANPRWVCLTSATFKGDTLTIKYEADFGKAEPNANSGYHLHIYGGDGTHPAAEIEGSQASEPGIWYGEGRNPSVRKASSKDYKTAIGDAPKVCARIAAADHKLVQDKDGTYVTGNCIPIDRTGFKAAAKQQPAQKPPAGNGSKHPAPTQSPTPTAPTPTPTATPTETPSPSITTSPSPEPTP